MKRNVYGQNHPPVIRTDNGSQFKSKAFYEFGQQMNLEHERIPNKIPNKNAYIEAFHSILERECLRRLDRRLKKWTNLSGSTTPNGFMEA
jgi:putative transposase